MQNISKNILLTIIITFIIAFFAAQTVGAKPANSPSLQAATGDMIIYGSNDYYNHEMVEINLSHSTYNHIGFASIPNQAMAQDPLTKYIYIYEAMRYALDFVYWDPATLTDTLVVHYSPRPDLTIKRMDFAPDGTLYMMDKDENIYSIDKQTGDIVFLGANIIDEGLDAVGDMAFAPDGTAYIATYESIYTMEYHAITDTWSSTLLFTDTLTDPIGVDLVWTGLAYCDGALYGSSGGIYSNRNDRRSGIYHIDLETGQTDMMIEYVGTVLNDLTSCQPKVEICDLEVNNSYDFYIDPYTATIDIDTPGTLACISVNRYNASHPQATIPLDTGNYWNITGLDLNGVTAVDFEVTLTLQTTFTPDNDDVVCRHTGTNWDCAMDSIGTNSITREGITEFSDWTIGNDAGPTSITLQSITAQKNAHTQIIWLFGLFLASMIVLTYRKRYRPKKS